LYGGLLLALHKWSCSATTEFIRFLLSFHSVCFSVLGAFSVSLLHIVRLVKGYSTYLLVFPIRGKILKPGFRVTKKRNPGKPVFSGFEMNAILSDKKSISLWNYYCWSLRNLLANY